LLVPRLPRLGGVKNLLRRLILQADRLKVFMNIQPRTVSRAIDNFFYRLLTTCFFNCYFAEGLKFDL
jgi:hypothetical protein